MAPSGPLDVWLEDHDKPIGQLQSDRYKALRFTYADGYLSAPDSHALSLALSLTVQSYGDAQCRAYFANLLQEGPQLDRVAGQYGLDRDDVAGLLFHLGRECPGAVSIVPEGEPPSKRPGTLPDDYSLLNDELLSREVQELSYGRSPQHNIEFSLAGVQAKLAIAVDGEGRIYEPLPKSGAPTTHILKIGDPDKESLIENEFFCLKLADALGLPVVQPTLRKIGNVSALLIPRFDRVVEDNKVRRLHQEDMCQALGLPPQLKYERYGERGSGYIATLARLFDIRRKTADPIGFQEALIKITFFNFLIGNSDAHAKNFSLLYTERRPRLAPFYDLLSIALYPGFSQEFALRVGGKDRWDELNRDDWMNFLHDAGVLGKGRDRIFERMLEPMAAIILDRAGQLLGEHGLEMTRVRLIRDCIGERIRHLNGSFGWQLGVSTDAFVVNAPGWSMS